MFTAVDRLPFTLILRTDKKEHVQLMSEARKYNVRTKAILTKRENIARYSFANEKVSENVV